MNVKKAVYIGLGCLGLALGAIGAVVPLLPAFPFLMLATVCFGKSSERLHNWFLGTNLYKDNLSAFVKGQGMTWRFKIRIMIIVTVSLVLGFVTMQQVPVGRIILGIVWACHVLYFIFGIKTIRPNKMEEKEITAKQIVN